MIKLEDIHIEYDKKVLLEKESIQIPAFKLTILKGASGCGKTALLYRIALISDDNNFKYFYDDKKLVLEKDKAMYRKDTIGFVLQSNDLLEHMSVKEIIIHHAKLNQIVISDEDIDELISLMKLEVNLNQSVATLSLGEKQRLAIACALVKKPKLLILDEPTASLDYDNEIMIYDILKQLSKDMTIIMSCHSSYIDEYADVIYQIENQHLNLIKGTVDNDLCTTNSHKKIKLTFFKDYCKIYLKHYRFIYLLMVMVLMISLLATSMFTVMINHALDNSKEILVNQFDNKIIITNDEDSKYINEEYDKYIKDFKQDNAYPLYQMKADINGTEVYIIPYFESDDFSKYVQNMFTSEDNGLYVDEQTYYALKDKPLNIQIMDHGKTYQKEVGYHFNGVFKDGVQQHYSTNKERYIYMPYHRMQELYDSFETSNEYIGYVLIFDSFDQLKESVDKLSNQYNINDTFTNIKAIDNITDYYQDLLIDFIKNIMAITLIIDIVINLHLYKQRRKEMCILKISGLENKHLHMLVTYELFVEIAIILLANTIIVSILMLILNLFSIKALITMLLVELMYIVIIMIERLLISKFYLTKIVMEKELRKE